MRLAVLASGTGTLLAGVVEAAVSGNLPVAVVGLVADRHEAGVLDRTGVACRAVVDPSDHADRRAWDQAVAETLLALRPDWVASLGFMRILGPAVLSAFPDRIINTHPALLPAFPGAHAVRDALAYGVRVTGCTIHLVDSGVDTGPVLAQTAVHVAPTDDEAVLHDRIKSVERPLVVEVLRRLAMGERLVRDPASPRHVRFGHDSAPHRPSK